MESGEKKGTQEGGKKSVKEGMTGSRERERRDTALRTGLWELRRSIYGCLSLG